MTPLRQRMLDDMQLRDLAPKTQEAYATAVRQLADYYGKSPDQISEEELRNYFSLSQKRETGVAQYLHTGVVRYGRTLALGCRLVC